MQDAWSRGQRVEVHALVYSLSDGLLHSLGFNVGEAESLEPTYLSALSRIARPTTAEQQ
ncbi:putative membrane protein (plasmid) [Caballeronia cordobensis]|nr:putative membrane protein [Burkholderia sp. RPE67]